MTDKIKRSLLNEILHELIALENYNAYDVYGEGVIRDTKVHVVPTNEIIQIDNTRLIKLLEYALGEDNIHMNCEWYDIDRDSCGNYMMGKYTGLAFDVSRHDKCIDELVER